jgi:hypothetical protein
LVFAIDFLLIQKNRRIGGFFDFVLGEATPTKQQPLDYAPMPSPDIGPYPHRSSNCEDP